MSVTSITFTPNASRLLNYVLKGEAHDGSGEGRYLFASGVGCFVPHAAREFAITRAAFGQRDVKRQAASVVQSFSAEEFDRNDPEAWERVHELGLELARRAFPGHSSIVVTQRDGKSGLLHNHIVVCGVSNRYAELIYWRKARSAPADKLALVEQKSADGMIEVREVRPAGRAFSSVLGSLGRVRRVNDGMLADAELMNGLGIEPYDNRELMKTPPERVTASDLAVRDDDRYNWRDDLKRIIREAQNQATSINELRERLAVERVELRQRGKAGAFSYGFIDAEGKHRQAKASSTRGLGADYGRDAAMVILERNQQRQAESAEQAQVRAFSHSQGETRVAAEAHKEDPPESFDEVAHRLRRKFANRRPRTPARDRYLRNQQRSTQKQKDREYGE